MNFAKLPLTVMMAAFYLTLTYTSLISTSNWTEWSTIQGVIGRVISKSAEREARSQFEITRPMTPVSYTHLTLPTKLEV